MATRTIVTSQPDVACDVCARRLLRGEQPDVFVAAGRRRIVCELCAPRAAHEGWLRETDSQSLSLPPMRPRRGRSLFDRLPVPFRVRQVGEPVDDAPDGLVADTSVVHEAQPYDLFADPTGAGDEELPTGPSRPQAVEQTPAEAVGAAELGEEAPQADAGLGAVFPRHDDETASEVGSQTRTVPAESSTYVEQAIAVFNASEFPRRVAGVARSLGAPAVTVRSAEHLSSVVSIVVAWGLCWYRYEVDLSEPVVEAQVIAQGTELAELAREDRIANAAAGESGTLVLPTV
jgi:hypothetical protein